MPTFKEMLPGFFVYEKVRTALEAEEEGSYEIHGSCEECFYDLNMRVAVGSG